MLKAKIEQQELELDVLNQYLEINKQDIDAQDLLKKYIALDKEYKSWKKWSTRQIDDLKEKNKQAKKDL